MGRDNHRLFGLPGIGVSIHAPAWGATKVKHVAGRGLVVSIHAPAWGATFLTSRQTLRRTRFNPRARMGRDFNLINFPPIIYPFQSTRPHGARPRFRTGQFPFPEVSIHAPAWGATFSNLRINSMPSLFQSTRPHGARPRTWAMLFI